MSSLGKFPDTLLAEIAGQPQAILRAAAAAVDQRDLIARVAALAGDPGRVVFTGMGSSYFAAYPAVTALARRGILASMIDAAELLHFRLDALDPGTLLICVSQSGESAETVRVAETLAGRGARPAIATVTNGTANSLAALADVALDTRAGVELGPSTQTFAGSLVLLDEVVRALVGDPPATAAVTEHAAAAAERLLIAPAEDAARLQRWLGDRPAMALLGRGGSRACSEMAALTLKEAARFPAEALQSAQFRHGPLELAGPELAVAIVACERATHALDLGLAAELVTAGAAVLVISPDGEAPAGALSVATGPVEDGLSSAVSIIPLQLLSWALARSRGLEPGTYTVATKVTTRE